MQIAAETATCHSLYALHGVTFSESSATARQSRLSQYKAIRRNGAVAGFEPILMAVIKAHLVRLGFDDGPAESVFPANVLEFRAFGGRAIPNGFASLRCVRPRQRRSGMMGSGRIRTFCNRTCFPAGLAKNSVRRGLPRRLNSLRLVGQV